jgi:hypothetical protein
LSIDDDNDTVDQNTNGELLHLPLIDWQKMSANVTTKPSLSKPTNANAIPILSGTQGTCDLNGISNVLNAQLYNQMPGLNNALPNNFRNICFGMQGRLGGLSSMNLGQWNPLQQMQALQTLASLGVGQIGQQGSMPMLVRPSLKQNGQGTVGSMPKVVGVQGIKALVPSNNSDIFGSPDVLRGD